MGKILAPSTKLVYQRAWACYSECTTQLNLPKATVQSLPLSVHDMLIFISYLHLIGRSPSTITTYSSALGFAHRLLGLVNPMSYFPVQKTLSTLTKRFSNADSRLPITLFILNKILDSLPVIVSNPYHVVLLSALFSTAFYGLFRVGEITIQNSGEISLNLDNVRVNNNQFIFSITKFKNNQTNKAFDVAINRQNEVPHCPFQLLLQYLIHRGTKPGPFFVFSNKAPVPRSFFAKHLKAVLQYLDFKPALYKSHSFRIGGASFLASRGYTDLQIKLMGRWNSDVFIRYIRDQRYYTGHPLE